MGIPRIVRTLAVVGIVGGLTITLSTPADAQKKVRWKMQSAFPGNLPHLGPPGIRFTKDVEAASGGTLKIKFFEPGALVPALECFDTISKGAIEACWTTPGYHTGKYPALAFFTAVPFGPQLGEFLAWKWHAGGNKFRDEIYAKHNMVAFDTLCIGPETSGWFRKPITSLDQLKGLKMRFFGLGAKVMQKMGVSTQLLAGADIYPALERGVIDATEFSMPTIDIRLGFYQIAKNNYYPGWHQQVSCGELLLNKGKWEALSNQHRAIVRLATGNQVIYNYTESEAANPQAMLEMKSKYRVTNHRWPDSTLRLLEKAWLEVIEEESAKDPLFKKVADHYLSFRETYKLWGDAQALKSTYQR